MVYSEDVESSKGEQYVYLATENVNVTEEQTSDADIMNTEDANDGSGDSTPYRWAKTHLGMIYCPLGVAL